MTDREDRLRLRWEFDDVVTLSVDAVSEKAVSEAVRNALQNLIHIGRAAVQAMMATWASGIAQTTKDNILDSLTVARRDSLGSEYVLDRIKADFSQARAQRIAVTEVTRFFGAGAQHVYKAAELPGWEWQTVEDKWVCPICTAKDNEQFDVDVEFEPGHPNCRCFPRPITEFSKPQVVAVSTMDEFQKEHEYFSRTPSESEFRNRGRDILTAQYSNVAIQTNQLIKIPGKIGEQTLIDAGDKRVRDLTSSMRRDGWKGDPIKVEVDRKGRLWIADGNHRIRAANEAGLEFVPTNIDFLGQSERLFPHEMLRFGTLPLDPDRVP